MLKTDASTVGLSNQPSPSTLEIHSAIDPMAKQDEALYLTRIGPDGYQHAKGKPWSDANCDRYLIQFGAILSLLPPPPARLLDMGCGTGWISIFFAKRGFDVCGVYISENMNRAAKEAQASNLGFLAADYEAESGCGWRKRAGCVGEMCT